MKELNSLINQVVVITGAGKGIGYQIASKFSSLGCKIAVISRTGEDLERLKLNLHRDVADILLQEGDVSVPETVVNFVNNVIDKFGKIDILVNNAGIRFRKNFLEITYQEWLNVMNVNLGSTFLFCQHVGRHMVQQKCGKIINIASIAGTLGLPELTAYTASKGGIVSLTKSLSLEWSEYNINVNAIAPGFCETSYSENFKKNTQLYNFTIDRTPMKRWGTADDVANACVYLGSDLSSYVTGEVLNVDGGWSAW